MRTETLNLCKGSVDSSGHILSVTQGGNRHCLMSHLCLHKNFFDSTDGEQIDTPLLHHTGGESVVQQKVVIRRCCFFAVDVR